MMKQPLRITLAPDLERFVEEKVKKGQFPSATHVVAGALEVLRAQETLTPDDIAELRQEIDVGLEQLNRGQSATWNAKALKTRLRRELKKKK